MNHGLNKYYNTISFDYINDIIMTAQRSLIDASNKNNIEAFNEILDFIQYTLLAKSFNKSLAGYSKTAATLIYVYPSINVQFKTLFLEKIFQSLVTTISLYENEETIDQKYIELSYLPLINITKLILEEDNHQAFNLVFKKIQENFFKLDYEKDTSGFFFKFITTLLCWIYYLKFQKNISYDKYELNYFEQNFENITIDFDESFLNKFFKLFNEIDNGLWSISNWEVKEPPVNVAYFALTPNSWLPFSLTILLLKYNHLIRANDDLAKIELDTRFKFILDTIKKILKDITIDNEEYVNFIFTAIDNKDLEYQLNEKKERILNVFTYLKKEIEIDEYKQIKEVPLSENKINEFRNNAGKLWEENLVIINILKHFDKVNYLTNIEQINGYGFFQTLLKMRFAFIEGKRHQTIIGLNDFGSKLARNIDNQFFQELLNNKNSVVSENISVTIDKFIDAIKDKKNLVIFANWKTEQKIGNIVYHEKIFFSSKKSYNNIPIVNSYNPYKDLIFIVDFSSIYINIYTSEKTSWYKNQLLIEVTEYQKGIITQDAVKDWNEKDGYEYNEEEIEILESNNVNIKILFKFEYLLNKKSNFLIINTQ